MVTVPDHGSVDTTIRLSCTVVEGKVVRLVSGNELPAPGVEVDLTYEGDGGETATTDPINGTFQFVCVRHAHVKVSTQGGTTLDLGDPLADPRPQP